MTNKKTYIVKIPVWEIIEVEVSTEETDAEKIKSLAVNQAVEEQPKVYWEAEPHKDIEIEEVQ